MLYGISYRLSCSDLSELLCDSLSLTVVLSYLMLDLSLVVAVHSSVVYNFPTVMAYPNCNNITLMICGVSTACLIGCEIVGSFIVCQMASDSGEEARRLLKHVAAEPERKQPRLVLDHVRLTACGFFPLDKVTAFQQFYNLLSMLVILI